MHDKPEVQPGRQVRIEIDDAVADGAYANIAFISSNNAEFILDFARFLPGNTRGKVISRVVLNPIHAKSIMKSLNEAVDQYEKKFGAIDAEPSNKNIGFQINRESNPPPDNTQP
jgi:hypothetical protein